MIPRKNTYDSLITRSSCPIFSRTANSKTPREEPTIPPSNKIEPILKSTFFRRQCAITPDTEDATIWFASVATATGAGIPRKISSGVIKKPPPTPNSPDKNPIKPPKPITMKRFREISAMGK